VLQSRVLRNIFEAKKMEVTGQGRKFITSFNYFLHDKIQENKTGWVCGTYGKEEMHTRLW
jgi:hypothetical protein